MSTNTLSLSRLLQAERRSLLRRLRRIVGNDTAEDVAQKLWLKIQTVEDDPPILNPRAYLHQLAMNAARDELRLARRRSAETQAEIDELLWLEDDTPSPDRIALGRDLLERIVEAIEGLPEPTRSIFRLNRFDGLAQREIAARYGVSTTIVERHIRRALKFLASVRHAS
ncbi:MAG: sigma-70 family RNA polymerase sigma factor [Sphingobium sp.]